MKLDMSEAKPLQPPAPHTTVHIASNILIEGALILLCTVFNEYLVLYNPKFLNSQCRHFMPDDQRISYPCSFSRIYQLTAIISTWVVPIIVLVFIHIMNSVLNLSDSNTRVHIKIIGFQICNLSKGLYLSVVYYINYYWVYLCLSFIEMMVKTYSGVHRPCFMTACNMDNKDILLNKGKIL